MIDWVDTWKWGYWVDAKEMQCYSIPLQMLCYLITFTLTFKNNNLIRSKFCTCPDSAAVRTCAKFNLIRSLEFRKIGTIQSNKHFHQTWILSSYICMNWFSTHLSYTSIGNYGNHVCIADGAQPMGNHHNCATWNKKGTEDWKTWMNEWIFISQKFTHCTFCYVHLQLSLLHMV